MSRQPIVFPLCASYLGQNVVTIVALIPQIRLIKLSSPLTKDPTHTRCLRPNMFNLLRPTGPVILFIVRPRTRGAPLFSSVMMWPVLCRYLSVRRQRVIVTRPILGGSPTVGRF